ncbi:retrovirus-related Pol polyprotein from transposon 297 [Trichonephila clavata]|uniref:Retrovirus-related Pol polyprotein from transposon 297 n=1 Tax=Trichonephila clavata TaxID=2740835 RepID=A0A8X6M5Y4_TRICU|nr:retrovirus-related Pol polyprotein from transposon 297 [Trichonephila clavata]
MNCLPLAEVEIDCYWGHVITKAAVVRKQLDQGRYILGNQTIELLESDLGNNSLPRREMVNAIQTRSQRKKEAEQKSTSEANENDEMKLEENLTEDIENLLPSFKEKDTMNLIKTNTEEFIKTQQEREELAPLIQKVENGINNEASDYSLTKRKLLIKRRKDMNGDLRQLLVIPEKLRSSILKMGHEGTSGHLEHSQLENRLNTQQIDKLKGILCNYSKIFSIEPGKTHLVEHGIELINEVPIRTKPYRLSARQTDLLQEEIKKVEISSDRNRRVRLCFTDLVETPGRDPRPCIDYRKSNELIRTQFYPLPNIEHGIKTVAAAKYITLLDLTKGYWQIPLTPKLRAIHH